MKKGRQERDWGPDAAAAAAAPGCDPEALWEQAALRWVLGLGAVAGAWWMLFGLVALEALQGGRVGVAAPAVILGVVPNLVWGALRREDRAAAVLGGLEALWRLVVSHKRLARPAKIALVVGTTAWAALAA